MSNERNQLAPEGATSRRRLMAGVAVAIGGMAARSFAFGKAPQQQGMAEKPGSAANQTRTSLHQENSFKASPDRIYAVLLDSKQFTAFTGLPAEIDPKAGGAFSMFGGLIVGRNVELVPNQRIVQAWRPSHWDPGVYSMVRFELKPQGTETLVILDHTGFPEGQYDHLSDGWNSHYWQPLTKFLA